MNYPGWRGERHLTMYAVNLIINSPHIGCPDSMYIYTRQTNKPDILYELNQPFVLCRKAVNLSEVTIQRVYIINFGKLVIETNLMFPLLVFFIIIFLLHPPSK